MAVPLLVIADFQVISAEDLKQNPLRKLTGLVPEQHLSYGVGVLGMPGSTAYGGLIDILQPVRGQTLWVSGAAGAVGSMVGQIAKNVFGCTVIGSAGGPKKCALCKELFGFDAMVDYKECTSALDLVKALQNVAPKGIDMYFENVGGMHFEAAMSCLRRGGRVAICGAISVYNDGKPQPNTLHVTNMIYTQQRIEGFVCDPWLSGKRGAFLQDMAKWAKEGKVKVTETHFDGIGSFGEAFQALFTGGNVGKVVVDTKPPLAGAKL